MNIDQKTATIHHAFTSIGAAVAALAGSSLGQSLLTNAQNAATANAHAPGVGTWAAFGFGLAAMVFGYVKGYQFNATPPPPTA